MNGFARRLLEARRRLPLWARWLTTIVIYLVLLAVAVVVVHKLASSSSSSKSPAEAHAVSEANNVGRIAISEDEAPHAAPLSAGASPAASLQRAISADVRRRIAHGELTGPLQSVHGTASGGQRASRAGFSCTVISAGITYAFLAVADVRTHELTWCKLDRAPAGDAALEVPVSPRCTA